MNTTNKNKLNTISNYLLAALIGIIIYSFCVVTPLKREVATLKSNQELMIASYTEMYEQFIKNDTTTTLMNHEVQIKKLELLDSILLSED